MKITSHGLATLASLGHAWLGVVPLLAAFGCASVDPAALINLASEEIDDAIRVLANALDPTFSNVPLHPAQQASLQDARNLLRQAVEAMDPAIRRARTESAISLVQNAKAAFGTNMNFTLGTGNLMF